MLGLYYMPALCYMQCCYEISVYEWFITHTHTNDLLNALLEYIKFYLYNTHCIFTYIPKLFYPSDI